MTRREQILKKTEEEWHPGAFIDGAEWADASMMKEIDHMISQLSKFAKTEHGQGQLAAWKEMKLFFK